MGIRRVVLLVLVLGGLGWSGRVRAQTDRAVPLLLQLPGSTRALGLGNAYTIGSTDADAIFYNPGLVDNARGASASLSHFGGSTLLSAAAAVDFWHGGIALGVQSLNYSAPDLASGAFARGEAGLDASGPADASEQVVTAAFARPFHGFRLGAGGKLIDQRIAGEHDATVAADVGVAHNLGVITAGISARNLGRQPEFPDITARLPTTVTLGASTRTDQLGPLDVSLAAAGSWMRGDQYAAGGGAEVAYWPVPGRTFIARLGYRWVEDSDLRPITLGAGFIGDRIILDYAFEDVRQSSPVHRFTVRWR